MNYIGVDLHKKMITVCVMDKNRTVLARKTLDCNQPDQIVEFFRKFQPFKVVVEATANYHWLVDRLEPLAEKVVLANPKKLRVIAESTKKTDRLDAQILAEFLARDMIPEAYMPTPRQRQHRILVRHRQYLRECLSSVRCKIRHILADHNADRKDLFSTQCGKAYLKQVPLSDAERFVIRQLGSEFEDSQAQLLALAKKIKAFAAKASQREAEARTILKTAPGVGTVTAEVILSELGEVSRFRNAKAVCAYAGLAPVVKQSGGKRSKDLAISKQGSGLLRWALVESAWRLVNTSPKWMAVFSRLRKRSGTKRAIVAVARKLLCVLYAMLRTSTPYKVMAAERAHQPPERRGGQDRIEHNLCESEPPVERRPVDVTTRRTTPQRTPTAAPSPTVVKLNGGVPWIPAEWRHRSDPVIPNRWLSESRHVG